MRVRNVKDGENGRRNVEKGNVYILGISYIKNPRLKQKDFLRIIFPQESITDESVETVIVTTSIEYINVRCEEK